MRVAIHPQTLDLREFRPGMGYQSKGYVIVKGAEGLYEVNQQWVINLFKKITGVKPKSINLRDCTLLWPDLVVRAINNVKAAVEVEANPEAGPGEFEHEKMPDSQGRQQVKDGDVTLKKVSVGRGNHNIRYPDFNITDAELTIRVPTQAQILLLEFQKLRKAGTILVKQDDVSSILESMSVVSRQDPLRIFRYYFWLMVRTGILQTVDGSFNNDRVVQLAQNRGFFKPWCTVTRKQAREGMTPDGT